jgi:hypothetical protein
MDAKPEANRGRFVYNSIPKKVSRKDFNRYIAPVFEEAEERTEAKIIALQDLSLPPVCPPYRPPVE